MSDAPRERPLTAVPPVDNRINLLGLRGLLDRPLASYYLLLSCIGLLLLIGLVMVYSATAVDSFATSGSAFTSVAAQMSSAVIGLVVFWVFQRLPSTTLRAVSGLAMIGAFLLMAFVDVLDFAAAIRTPPGADVDPIHLGPVYVEQLWLHIGPTQIQPAEFAKLALILWGADVLARRGRAVANTRELLMPLFPVAGMLFMLVGYNDLGSMICLVLLFVGLLWTAGARIGVFAWIGALMVAGVIALIVLPADKNYRIDRIKVFFDSGIDPEAEGPRYHYLRGMWAVSEGGWFGVGLGESHSKWGNLPNAHNDFIFAIIASELGVVGCFVVLGLFAALSYTGLRIARRVDDSFRRLVVAAITTWFVGQAVINVGGVVGLLPITGLPLPFISDGGSALVVALAAAGVLTAAARTEPDAAKALHARPPGKWVRLLWAPLPPLPRTREADGGARPPSRATTTRVRERNG